MHKESPVLNDHQLLKGLRNMDSMIIDQIYSRFYPMVLNMILQKSGNTSDARDVFQEAIIVIFEKCREEDFKLTSALSTYLYAISRNLWNKRKSRVYDREHSVEDNLFFEYQQEIMVDDDEQTDLEQLKIHFKKLTEKCKDVIRLTYYAALKDKEIAEVLGLSGANYVKTQRHRCIKQLRTFF